jgi:hypothetical protein
MRLVAVSKALNSQPVHTQHILVCFQNRMHVVEKEARQNFVDSEDIRTLTADLQQQGESRHHLEVCERGHK